MKKTTSRRLFLRKSAVVTTGLVFLSSNVVNAFIDESPYQGYNPYSEEKTDLRTGLFGKHARIKGTIYNKTGGTPIVGAIIEVWHLSPNSTKYRHRAKLKTNSLGEYNFITDFPNKEKNKCPRVFFKVSHNNTSVFTEVLFNDRGAYITSKHWEDQSALGSKLLPKFKKSLGNSTINFNISI